MKKDRQKRKRTQFVMSVPEAGEKYFGLSRNASYKAAKDGTLPTIKIGGAVFVPIAAVEKLLDVVPEKTGSVYENPIWIVKS